jgi:two-component system sensor histidine kinase HydH
MFERTEERAKEVSGRRGAVRVLALAGMVIGISVLHYTTSTRHYFHHDVYARLYYAPIVIAAFWFGLRGSIVTSLCVSLVYVPHIAIQWSHDIVGNPNRYLEIVLFNVIGLVVGALARGQKMHRQKLSETANALEQSYAKLREQTDLLLEMEEELRHADRLAVLGELSATMAHEVKNPLAAVKGAVEILADSRTSPEEREEFLTVLEKEVERLARVVNNYLSLARRTPVQGGQADSREVVRSVVALVEGRARKQGKSFRVVYDGKERPVSLHPDLLRQVLLNLILNSLYATGEGGTVTVETESRGEWLSIAVSDTGRGIPEKDMEKVFEPFYTTRPDGTGLGLPIVKRIVEESGGSVELESREGLGTRVRILLPIGGGH